MADDFFGEDPFDSIIREFFGRTPRRNGTFISGEEEDRNIDFIEGNDYVYFIFELPGYNEEDINISIKGRELQIRVRKKITENVQAYLSRKLSQEVSITKNIPNFISPKRYKHTMKNGVLEIVFNKK